jgi:hypothetical protein
MTTLANFVTEFGFRSDGSFERAMQNMQRRLSSLGSSLEANTRAQSRTRLTVAEIEAKKLAKIEQDRMRAALRWQRTQEGWANQNARTTNALNRPAPAQDAHVRAMQDRQARIDATHTRAIMENRRRERAAAIASTRERERQHSEALRMNAARERAERQTIARTDQAARRQAAEQLRQQRATDRATAATRRAEQVAERQRMAERLRNQRNADRITRQNDAELRRYLNRTGGGQNHNVNRYSNTSGGGSGGGGSNRILPHVNGGGSNPLSPLGGIPLMGRTTMGQMAGGFGIAELVRQSYQAANFQARTMPTLKFITKDPTKSEAENDQAAQVEKDFIDRKVKELSLDKVGATKAYTDFAASAYKPLGSKGTQDLFEGAQGIGIMTGRTPAQMELAMKAFGQMAG